MFQKTTLYKGNEILEIAFEEGKTYLLMIAQNCDMNHIVINHASDIYTIISPAVIFGNRLYEDGILVCELKRETTIVHRAHQNETEEKDYMEKLAKSKSVLLLVHWLDPKIYQYVDDIFSLTSEDVSIMGAGCGRTTIEMHSVMTHNGVELLDGFLVLFSTQKLFIGAKHGASFYNGYYIARTEKSNKIVTINGESAAPFYAKIIQKYFNEQVTCENIFSIGLRYPIGLGTTSGENPIRVPVAMEEDSIIVSGPMDMENTISLMCAEREVLFKASSAVALEAKKNICNLDDDQVCFIIEGAGRQLVLGELFPQELENIASNLLPSTQCYGLLSLGEIANSSDKYIEYSNEACVVGVFDATK